MTPAAGGPAATPPLATRLLRPSPSLPRSSCFYSLVPAKAKEVLSGLLPEERARRFRKLLPTPRQSSDSRRRGRTRPSAPKVSRESAAPPRAGSLLPPSPPAASRPLRPGSPLLAAPDPEVPVPKALPSPWPARGEAAARRPVTLAVTEGPRLRTPDAPAEGTRALSPTQSTRGTSSRGPGPIVSGGSGGSASGATAGSGTAGGTLGRLRLRAPGSGRGGAGVTGMGQSGQARNLGRLLPSSAQRPELGTRRGAPWRAQPNPTTQRLLWAPASGASQRCSGAAGSARTRELRGARWGIARNLQRRCVLNLMESRGLSGLRALLATCAPQGWGLCGRVPVCDRSCPWSSLRRACQVPMFHQRL